MLAAKESIEFPDGLPLKTSLHKIIHQQAHFHENAIEMLFVLKGTIHMRSSHRHVTLHEDDVFSIDPEDIHCIYSDTENLVLFVHIDIINDLYPKERMYNCFFACETQNIQSYQESAMYQVKDLLLAAALEYVSNSTPSKTIITNISRKLIQALVKHFDWLSFMWDPTDSNPLLQERFHRIISYCQSNYKQKISISMLAEKEHFNENYFSTLMKKTSFEGFNYMLNFFRCDGAERMLLTTNESILEISRICGFSDPKYFYKHFNKWWSLSPAKLRRWYRDYCVEDVKLVPLSHSESQPILKDYLAEYHVQRVFFS